MKTPTWALTIAYWVHMLATVIWIGGLAIVTLFVIPTAQNSLDKKDYSLLLGKIQQRLDPLAWFSVAALLGSGMLQMSASPHYQGFLAIKNQWAGVVLVKHLFFGLMVMINIYTTWGIMPALRRATFKQAQGKETPEIKKLQKREIFLVRLNLFFGFIVLLLTAIARSS